MSVQIRWQTRTTPAELRPMLTALGDAYPIRKGPGHGLEVQFENVDEPGLGACQMRGQTATIQYATPAQAGRAVGALLAGMVSEKRPYQETTPFTSLGIMLDCSRNAVMTVEHVKLWMQRLALLGYNTVMLYTEDTYELPDEPYFGYQRGPYTASELKEIDACAARLNIEVIPCIQTLGHLTNLLRHAAYRSVKDTSSVLLVGEKKTHALIDKMIQHWREVCRTDRIHVGMDETHDLGRGQYMDLNGYREGFDLFNEHLARVVRMCRKHGFRPMIWSDMYFRLGSKTGDYYDPGTIVPPAVVRRIPAQAELVYWDYYHADREFYLDWIERHRNMGKEPIMGSGIWTWNKYWYDPHITEATAGPCIDACREAQVKELFFTQWGDNGAYCDHDSAFAGMVWCADRAYGHGDPPPRRLEQRFAAVCGGSYRAHIQAGDLHGGIEGVQPDMWDDPIFETRFRQQCGDDARQMAQVARGYAALARKLRKHCADRATGDLAHAHIVARAFAARYDLSARLLAAYRGKDRNRVRSVRRRIPKVVEAIRQMEESFRAMWMSHNKPEGLETIEGRFGMVEARYRELDRRLAEYGRGSIGKIAELEYGCPPK